MTRQHRRLEPGRLVLASHNAGKLREVAALVAIASAFASPRARSSR